MYGVLDAGVKYAHIVLAGKSRVEAFDFALPVPGSAFVGNSCQQHLSRQEKQRSRTARIKQNSEYIVLLTLSDSFTMINVDKVFRTYTA